MSAQATAAKKGGRLDVDRTRAHLDQLGLAYASEKLPELLSEAVKGDLPPHRFLDELLDEEVRRREERRIRTSLRLSGLPVGQTLGNFDFSFQPSIEKSRIETLATCAWIREKEGLLLAGPPGVEDPCRRGARGQGRRARLQRGLLPPGRPAPRAQARPGAASPEAPL